MISVGCHPSCVLTVRIRGSIKAMFIAYLVWTAIPQAYLLLVKIKRSIKATFIHMHLHCGLPLLMVINGTNKKER